MFSLDDATKLILGAVKTQKNATLGNTAVNMHKIYNALAVFI
jgi:hypothetical protein